MLKNQTLTDTMQLNVYTFPKAMENNVLWEFQRFKDRVVQAAIKIVIEPIFEHEFLPITNELRPHITVAKMFYGKSINYVKSGYTFVVDTDMKSYFDSIPHELLVQRVEEHVSNGKLLDLIRLFLQQEVMDGLERWIPTNSTPQGAVFTPFAGKYLLASIG